MQDANRVAASYTVGFDDVSAADRATVGGKGANLGVLTQAGFVVPPGFTIATSAYADFASATDLGSKIGDALAGVDVQDPAALAPAAQGVRDLIEGATLPEAIADEVLAAYRSLGASAVAVRSSSTAEDSTELSFAGQHDTYLNVRGEDAVLAAVLRCWASFWTDRATVYRVQQGIDGGSAGMAVVVQAMIDAEVAGVMFTANPMTEVVNEIVVNASWGLGEGVVSGIVTPDAFVLDRDVLRIKDKQLGSKAVRIDRDPGDLTGTVETEVADPDRRRYALTDAQVKDLGTIGRAVTEHYEGFPQDIEWAYADGSFYLLQARDITGVDISWDEDLDAWQTLEVDDDAIWSRAWSDETWTGAVTPLFYSIRSEEFATVHANAESLWGFDDVAKMRYWKYHKAEVYFNSKVSYYNLKYQLPPALRRPEVMGWIPPQWHEQLVNEPFSWTKLAKVLPRIRMLDPDHGPYRWFKNIYDVHMATQREDADGLSSEEISRFSDEALKRYAQSRMDGTREWVEDQWSGFHMYAPISNVLLAKMLEEWYTGDNEFIFGDLITGLPRPTNSLIENTELWEIARELAESDELVAIFNEHEGAAFFEELENHDEGRALLVNYNEFLARHAHRGHSDRDIIFARRSEDPEIDYASLKALLTADRDSVSPEETEKRLIARREEATEEVLRCIRRQPLGAVKAEAFKVIHNYIIKFLLLRDDERHHFDRWGMSKKRALMEISNRLRERGLLETETDFYFLAKDELFEVLDGQASTRLVKAKIAARRRNFERYNREFFPPKYMRGNEYADLDVPATTTEDMEGVFKGIATSRGLVTGTARIVRSQKEIGRVQQGDIMITNSTDPGWTPVFLIIKGLVLETGGMLAHGSCISREYGLPAVQVESAMQLIEDGATITLDGNTGEVRLVPDAASNGHGGSETSNASLAESATGSSAR